MMNQFRNQVSALFVLASLLLASCTTRPPVPTTISPTVTSPPENAAEYTYSVVASYPHDPNAFTQGLVYDGGTLYEGTGLVGLSSLRKVDLETGIVRQVRELPAQFFGEGITTFGGRVFQLTWQSRVGFVYDKATFEPLREFAYSTEGWGLTHDGKRLIMSDGTSTLYYLDPETLQVTGQIEVRGSPDIVGSVRLNELEYVRGEVYANVWPTSYIVRIAPDTGRVTGWTNLDGLLGSESGGQPVDVLNGIAYDAENDRLFVTGKLWPRLFEIKLLRRDESAR